MAAASAVQHPTVAGRSHTFSAGLHSPRSSYRTNTGFANSAASQKKPNVLTSSESLGHVSRGSPHIPPASYSPSKAVNKPPLRPLETDMSSYTSTTTYSPASRSDSRMGKLRKRNSSGTSIPASPSPLSTTLHAPSSFDAPVSGSSANSTQKIKPYLRKFSSTKEVGDQGRIDLSKSFSENGSALAGLGIHDFGKRSNTDLAYSGRMTPHMRSTSNGSHVSTASGSYKSTTFVHPMKMTPTPNSYPSSMHESSMNEDEVNESSDIVTEDENFALPNFRSRRSISVSSNTPQQQLPPTPLSQSHTAEDLGMTPKLTTSQTNLSLKSSKSEKQLPEKPITRPRNNTIRTASDFSSGAHSYSARNSFDRPFSLLSRKSESSQRLSEQEIIRQRRQEFMERQSSKEEKYEREDRRRRERQVEKEEKQRRRSEAEERRLGSSGGRKKVHKTREPVEALPQRGGDGGRATDLQGSITALPGGNTEKPSGRAQQAEQKKEANWFVRMLSCGG